MTGIFLLAVICLWLWICFFFARVLMRSMHPRALRWVVVPLVFVAQLALPVADEIVGGFQFRALCEKNAVFRMGVAKPEGRVTRELINPSNEEVAGTAITIYHTGLKYTDIQSGETVVAFDRYVAKGGIFIRALGISEGNAPITMDRASCSPEQIQNAAAHQSMKFTVTN